METRNQNSRLDSHEQQIKQLQFDVTKIKQLMTEDRKESAEFRKMMVAWMKQFEKESLESSGSGSGPKVSDHFETHPHIPPLFDASAPPLPWAVKKGVAQHWFTVVTQVHESLTWTEFYTELLQRFSGLEINNLYEQLATIKQSNSILDYIDDFEYLLSLVPRLPESQTIGYFVAGPRDDVKKWVRLHRPQTRLDAIYLAKDVEAMLRPTTITGPLARFRYGDAMSGSMLPGSGSSEGRGDSKSTMSGVKSSGILNPLCLWSNRLGLRTPFKMDSNSKTSSFGSSYAGPTGNRDRGMRSLSQTEWEERRKKGLCFRCGQLYGPTHRCPEGKLRVLLLGDDEEEGDKGDQFLLEGLSMDSTPESPTGTCLALEVAGLLVHQDPHTFKLEGAIQGIPISLLVDSGATHNFISSKILSALEMVMWYSFKTNVWIFQCKLGVAFSLSGCWQLIRGILTLSWGLNPHHPQPASLQQLLSLEEGIPAEDMYKQGVYHPLRVCATPSVFLESQKTQLHGLLTKHLEFRAVWVQGAKLVAEAQEDHVIQKIWRGKEVRCELVIGQAPLFSE
ncbi:hypothetical protein E3N88_09068 [Mikania micrantha]|uniref:Retrotransposon gag domain-containing protein n=1 Tax=Mikania micrantha TaxID=192012 RepID=A0A5N6PIM9_9ASTR|nr:hypothetical protein E3N88_09068 [Mikania micrantha]